jgi:hypothetical protein
MKTWRVNLLIVASFLILFSAISYNLFSQSLWDGDFWWHIAAGRYIIDTGSLPEKDPFSFTSELEENKSLRPERESFILKQYWLAQVIFYLIYSHTGAKGIIILKSLLHLLLLLLIFWGLYQRGVRSYIIFVFIFLVYISATPFTGERPVLFTIIFSVITFLLLDNFLRNKNRKIYLLIPLMLLWSNMHGGFILGDVIILTFMLGELINIILKRTTYSRREILIFYSVAILSIIASSLNPNGLQAFLIAFSPKYKHFTMEIQEYQPPFIMYKEKLTHINWGYIIIISLFPLILFRIKKINFAHLLLLSGLLFMGLNALRFTIYYSAIGAIVLGSELNLLIEQLFNKKLSVEQSKRMTAGFTLAMFFSAILYFGGVVRFEGLRFKHATWYSIPEKAVDFIEENKLPGNIFNDFLIGGYLAWRLYPWKKNFIDTRGLNYTVMFEYGAIISAYYSLTQPVVPAGVEVKGKTPLWEKLLDHYDINIILMLPVDVYGYVPLLLFELLKSDKWVPIYTDYLSIIFIRNVNENKEIIKKFRRSKDDVYNTVLLQASLRAMYNKINPRYLMSIGETFFEMGRLKDALTAYEYALNRMPENASIKERIEQIRSQL